jgi:hypothetical protein
VYSKKPKEWNRREEDRRDRRKREIDGWLNFLVARRMGRATRHSIVFLSLQVLGDRYRMISTPKANERPSV